MLLHAPQSGPSVKTGGFSLFGALVGVFLGGSPWLAGPSLPAFAVRWPMMALTGDIGITRLTRHIVRGRVFES